MESDGSLTPSRSQNGFARNYNDGVGQGSASDGLAILGETEVASEHDALRFTAFAQPALPPRADVLSGIEATTLRYANHPGLRRAELSVRDWLALYRANIEVESAGYWLPTGYISSAILAGIDSIAGALVASVGGGSTGPSGTFAEEFDRLISELGNYLNAAGSELNWMAGAMLDIVGVLLLSILGGLAAFILLASRLMIALLIGIAPVMIFLTLFEVTKDYFAHWISALISFAIYPIVIAVVFTTITGLASALIGELDDPEGASNISALLPFFMMVLMAKRFIIATPFIVRAISGNIMMSALSGGLGGGYSFARAAMGSQQAYNRYLIGGASGAEYAALRARQFFGVQHMPLRSAMDQKT